MQRLGQLLFGVGTIIAISAAAKLPAEPRGWPDTTWIFAIGAALAGLGVVLWRAALRTAREASVASESAAELTLLGDLIEPTRRFVAEIDGLEAGPILERVDQLLETYLLPFAEVRQQIISRFGMAAGAEILVTAAYGERMLNRVWSAAADGHLPEARAALPEAFGALDEAWQLTRRAMERTRKVEPTREA